MIRGNIKFDYCKNKTPKLIAIGGIFLSLLFATRDTQYFNREIILILLLLTVYSIIKNSKSIRLTLPQINFIVVIILFVLIDFFFERGSRATSYINIIIFGYIYYIIAPSRSPKNIYEDFISIIKILLCSIVIEQFFLFFRLIDGDAIKKYIPLFHIYTSKFIEVTELGGQSAQSLYLGPQIASMIVVFGIILFFPYRDTELFYSKNNYWLYLSLILFIFIFTFTSVIMLLCWLFLIFIFYKKSRNYALNLFTPILFGLVFISIKFFLNPTNFDYGSTQFEAYWITFTDLITKFFSMDSRIILFGVDKKQDTAVISRFHELGFGIILAMLGFLFLVFIFISHLNILLGAIKNKANIHRMNSVILLTILLTSCLHYLVILKTGPALLFGLIIYYYLVSVNNQKIN